MRDRCNNPNNKAYKNYGGRGITVCNRWKNFVNFITDVGERPLGLTLDRINNELGYFPENVRWTDNKTQVDNRRVRRIEKFSTAELEAELLRRHEHQKSPPAMITVE
jgi:hypothetical protein